MAKVSMRIIAEKLKVSKATVSLALNGKPGVSDEMRATIINTAKELNYHGANFLPQSKNKILLMIPEYIRDDHFFTKIFIGQLNHTQNKWGAPQLFR